MTALPRSNNRALLVMAICLTFAYLLPYHVLPFSTFYHEWLAIFGVIVISGYWLEEKIISLRLPWIALVPISLAFIIAAQAAMDMLNLNWDAFMPILYLLLTAFAIIIGARTAAEQNGSEKLCNAIAFAHLAAGFISTILATVQYCGAELGPLLMSLSHEPGSQIRPYANIGQPNQLALLMCLAIASTWWLYQREAFKVGILLISVLILIWGLVITQSKIGWIIIPLFGIGLWMWNAKYGIKALPGKILVLLVSFYVISVAFLPILSAWAGIDVATASERVSASSAVRLTLFLQALKMSTTHFWVGAGWGQFGPEQLMMAGDFPITQYSRHAHNIILNLAAEIGWPITFIILCNLIYWGFRCSLARPANKKIAFATLFFAAIFIHSLVEYPLWYAFVLLPAALLIGMVHQETLNSVNISVSRNYLAVFFVCVCFGAVAIAADYARVVKEFRKQEYAEVGIEFAEQALVVPTVTVFPYMFDYLRFAQTKARPNMSETEIAEMERATKRFGATGALVRMSEIYALNNRPEDAIKTLVTLAHLHPDKYKEVYKYWSAAPNEYQNIFRQIPVPVTPAF